jgi:hypothetical protein
MSDSSRRMSVKIPPDESGGIDENVSKEPGLVLAHPSGMNPKGFIQKFVVEIHSDHQTSEPSPNRKLSRNVDSGIATKIGVRLLAFLNVLPRVLVAFFPFLIGLDIVFHFAGFVFFAHCDASLALGWVSFFVVEGKINRLFGVSTNFWLAKIPNSGIVGMIRFQIVLNLLI